MSEEEHEKLHELMPIVKATKATIQDMDLTAMSMEASAKVHDKMVMIRNREQMVGCTVTIKCKGNYSDFVAPIGRDIQEEIIALILKYYQTEVNDGYEEIQKLKEKL